MLILDHVKMIGVSDNYYINETTTLSCLRTGLNSIYATIKSLENQMQQQDRERRKQVFAFGFGIFELYGIDPSFEELTPCLFHWFGTSMCNYARLVGWLEGANSNQFSFERPADQASAHQVKSYCDAYVRSVYELSEVVVWRNKVFAHFALTDPRLGDNEATLNMSTMSPVTYARDRLRVGELIHSGSDGDATLPPWSITEVYEAISARYWP